MGALLRNTWIAVIVAFVAVVASGVAIVRSFSRHVRVECSGRLVEVPRSTIRKEKAYLERIDDHDFQIQYRTKSRRGRTEYTNVRVVWNRSDAEHACSDLQLPWPKDGVWHPASVTFRRAPSGLWVVERGHIQVPFRTVEAHGRRFVPARASDPQSIPMLVFLLSVGALAIAAARALRASPYATRMSTWKAATLREDGLVESESGATIGTMAARSRWRPGPVIVSPAALEGHEVYRSMPVLTRRDVAMGSHEVWRRGTMRRLRDARTLAVVATVTTLVAVMAHLIAG